MLIVDWKSYWFQYLRSAQLRVETWHDDWMGQQLGKGHQLPQWKRRSFRWIFLSDWQTVQRPSHLGYYFYRFSLFLCLSIILLVKMFYFTTIVDYFCFSAYSDLQSRKETREAAWRKPGWDECVAYTVPLIQQMHTRIMVPLPFSPTQ